MNCSEYLRRMNGCKCMKKERLIIGVLLFLGALRFASAAGKCDRPCLVNLMDRYLAAAVKHDPSGLPIARDAKFVENLQQIPVGKGLWETAKGGPTEFKIYVADPVAGQIGFMGVMQDKGNPVLLGARLKLVNGNITEIDHMVSPLKDPLPAGLLKPRPGLIQKIQTSERVSREQMRKAANAYYDAIEQSDGKVAPFADECQRRENGGISANDQTQTPEEAKKDDFSVFRKMTCCDQLSTGVMSYIKEISNRRILAEDEEMGLVFAYSIFRHDGTPKMMAITGVPGITERKNPMGPFDLPAAHIFKIRNGKIYEIEAIGYVAKHGIKNGWE
jgi:hypothetical protein